MQTRWKTFGLDQVKLLPSLFKDRFEVNRRYVNFLKSENLLQNFYFEAGLFEISLRNWGTGPGDERHWGWESTSSAVRGHFVGHWLSAAAKIYRATDDGDLKVKADRVVAELARCQQRNGGQWCGSIPEKYLDWIARGETCVGGPPQYVLHKTMMGLFDMYAVAGNELALEILEKFAQWFNVWTSQFSRDQMDKILNVETGGMLELWADLYSVTGRQEHLDLLHRYDRPRLFEPLLDGEDALSGQHANTTIPEALGAARAYEVTADLRWRRIAEAYWRCAVTDRGYFCTGGQTAAEGWTRPFELAGCLEDRNQEHCTVYNMMRLAEYLLRWNGDAACADYMERNLYNGILAQQNPLTGMVSYYLPLRPGGRKYWSAPTHDFWCCLGTMVQAHTIHSTYIYYHFKDGLALCQYIPSQLEWDCGGSRVKVRQSYGAPGCNSQQTAKAVSRQQPHCWVVEVVVQCDKPAKFTLKLRLPWWLKDLPRISVNDKTESVESGPSSFHSIRRNWHHDRIRIELPKGLSTCPLPDEAETVAFLDGPVVLAGLCDQRPTLYGNKDDPSSILTPENEQQSGDEVGSYRGRDLRQDLKFKPLYEVVDERYTIYFPIST